MKGNILSPHYHLGPFSAFFIWVPLVLVEVQSPRRHPNQALSTSKALSGPTLFLCSSLSLVVPTCVAPGWKSPPAALCAPLWAKICLLVRQGKEIFHYPSLEWIDPYPPGDAARGSSSQLSTMLPSLTFPVAKPQCFNLAVLWHNFPGVSQMHFFLLPLPSPVSPPLAGTKLLGLPTTVTDQCLRVSKTHCSMMNVQLSYWPILPVWETEAINFKSLLH